MKIIDEELLNEVCAQAKKGPRLRMNYNFHRSLDEKCHRLALPSSVANGHSPSKLGLCSHCSIGF